MRLTRLIATGLVVFAVAACAPDASTSGTPRASATATLPALTSVTAAAIPTEPPGEPSREAVKPDPAFDYGFVIDITPGGFHPNWLVAACCHPITWINLTNKPNAITFTVELVHGPPIPPGGSWVWTPPNAESVAYQSGPYPAMTGVIQVNQTTE